MELKKLLEGVEVRKIIGDAKREIEGIAYHSHRVRKHFLFAALQGLERDGRQFIKESVERGAEVILTEKEDEIADRTLVLVRNSRQALARVASNFYGNPSAKVCLIGITGTNGKTTTTYLLESILMKAGHRVGVIGTINYRYGQKAIPAFNTTPESLDLQRILSEMLKEGITHVIMEVSSHGLDLDRVFGCQFDGAVFTNLTSEHLDYHHTLDRYFESKRRLFSESLIMSSKPGRFAVTNHDDPRGEEIIKGVPLPVLRYGLDATCDIYAKDIHSSFEGITCRIQTPQGEFPLHSKLIGRFNLYNILTAVATGIGMGLSLNILREGVEGLEGVSGRFETVANRRGIHIVVDYAHTDDALERVLLGLKEILNRSPQGDSKIITTFGCGGDRDRTKRPRMGEVAGKNSDLVILTSDNPRTEDPLAIMDEVEKGLQAVCLKEWDRNRIGTWRSEKGYLKIPDRKEAIRMAIRIAQPRDAVLIAGKGHEDYQIIGKQRFPFDDRVEARKALEEV